LKRASTILFNYREGLRNELIKWILNVILLVLIIKFAEFGGEVSADG